jgi:arylsulfatase A-like enzyme
MFLSLLLALAAPVERPNILFVFTDDHASHAISAYGSKINTTPNIDRLAREGMLFRNCFCTNSICSPSRAVILTGKHSHLNGVLDNRQAFDGKQEHLGKLFTEGGYQTALIGKWHLKSDPTGFQHWAVLTAGGGQGTYYNPEFKTNKGMLKTNGYVTDITTDMTLEWLEKRETDKPFLLMYQHKAPHREWAPGPNQLGLYRDKDIPEPSTLFDDNSGLASPAQKQEMTIANHFSSLDMKLVYPPNMTPEQKKVWDAAYAKENADFTTAKLTGKDLVRWKYQRYIKDYLRCVAGVDDNLGRVLKYLDDKGLSKNTIVIYSSDQGFYLGDRGWYDKRWMYEESLRMPFIVRWPGVVKSGSENRDLVQNLDFAQTLLEAAGIEAPKDMQGHSLVPLLKGETPKDWRSSIYYHYFEYPGPHMVQKHYGVRTKTHKLIYYYPIDEWELFDLVADPGERKSVYSDPKYADVVKTLKAELDRLRKHYKADTFKEPEEPKEPKRGDPSKVKTQLRLHYPMDKVTDGALTDSVGKAPAKLVKVRYSLDSDKSYIEFGGAGHLAVGAKLDPSWKPLTVGAHVWLNGSKGVVFAHGGEAHGYALHFEEGVPVFSVRSQGRLTSVKGDNPLPRGRWIHLMGQLDAGGKIRVWVDGKAQTHSAQAGHVTQRPADGISIGRDTGSPVGNYKDEGAFIGRIREVRVYWGTPSDKEIETWLGS